MFRLTACAGEPAIRPFMYLNLSFLLRCWVDGYAVWWADPPRVLGEGFPGILNADVAVLWPLRCSSPSSSDVVMGQVLPGAPAPPLGFCSSLLLAEIGVGRGRGSLVGVGPRVVRGFLGPWWHPQVSGASVSWPLSYFFFTEVPAWVGPLGGLAL